jgi:hypothetical protein
VEATLHSNGLTPKAQGLKDNLIGSSSNTPTSTHPSGAWLTQLGKNARKAKALKTLKAVVS